MILRLKGAHRSPLFFIYSVFFLTFCFSSFGLSFEKRVPPPGRWEESCSQKKSSEAFSYGLCWDRFAEELPSSRRPVIVAILDSGVSPLPQLQEYLIPGWNFVVDSQGHSLSSTLPEFIRSRLLIGQGKFFPSIDFLQHLKEEEILQKKYFDFLLSVDNSIEIRQIYNNLFQDPQLDPEISQGVLLKKEDGEDHGTFMASIMVRLLRKLPASYQKNIRFLPLRILAQDGDERDEDIAHAIRFAREKGASVINMSFGKPLSPSAHLVEAEIQLSQKQGILFVHSVGNHGKNIDQHWQFPYPQESTKLWIQVGSVTQKIDQNFVQAYSNYGVARNHIFAPGDSIQAFNHEGALRYAYGSSPASAIVSITAATLLSSGIANNSIQVQQAILQASLKFPELKVIPPSPMMEPMPKSTVSFCQLASSCGALAPQQSLQWLKDVTSR